MKLTSLEVLNSFSKRRNENNSFKVRREKTYAIETFSFELICFFSDENQESHFDLVDEMAERIGAKNIKRSNLIKYSL